MRNEAAYPGMIWQGWRDADGWGDARETNRGGTFGSTARIPTHWAPRLPKYTVEAGKQLVSAADEEELPVQGAMWAHSPKTGSIFQTLTREGVRGRYPHSKGWKYLLATPDITKVRDRLPELFRSGRILQAMVIDDVAVVCPENPMFQLLTK
jgi:hypothetical protein